MKHLLFLIGAVTLMYLPVYSQGAELTVIPRVDFNTRIPLHASADDAYSWQSSGLYTLLEGSAFDGRLTYNLTNLWLNEKPEHLYKNTGHTDDVNWLTYAYLTWQQGAFDFTAGKQFVLIGGFELDPPDYECFAPINSVFWYNSVVYQWGGTIGYTSPSENHYVAFQYTTSPFVEKLKDNDLGTWSLYWTGSFGALSTIGSANLMEYEKDHYLSILALGGTYEAGSLTFGADWINRAADTYRYFNQEMTLTGFVSLPLCHRMDLTVKGGYERTLSGDDFFGWGEDGSIGKGIVPDGLTKDYAFGGCVLQFYPLRDNRDFRLHAVAATNNYADAMMVSFGASYVLRTNFSRRKQ